MTYESLTQLAQSRRIILGTRSPRRIGLFRETGVSFDQVIPAIEENMNPSEPPYEYAERLACEKALSVSDRTETGDLVLGCDTIVVLGDQVLQKPLDEADAMSILTQLSGREHVVCTALAWVDDSKVLVSGYELTNVFFNHVTEDQIGEYIATGEPMDKAGAYGIQGMGAFLVDRIEGNLDNVIGLPRRLLEHLSRDILTLIEAGK